MSSEESRPFPGFKHVCLFGLGRGGVDDEVRTGLVKFRGQTHKWLLHDVGRYCEYLERVENGSLDCDLLVGNVNSEGLAERLRKIGKPVLDLMRMVEAPAWQTHWIDYRAVGEMGGRYLKDLGHRNLAFYTSDWGSAEQAIWEGFRGVLEKHAASLSIINRHQKVIRYFLPGEREESITWMSAWFPKMLRPLALLVNSDGHAATVAELAFFSGVSVPEELCILGIGDVRSTCETAHPGLSSISLPGEKLGYVVGEHIDRFFKGERVSEFLSLPPRQVVVRTSTDLSAIQDHVVAKAVAMMRREAANRVPIAEIIRKLPVSKRSFNDRFLKAIGRTPREELFRIRLEMARERLLQTNQTVLHVAMDCGFADTESMVRLFKESTGLTPTQFRRQNRV
ncbi:MAG: helix-turn-helix domain-containing protein [Oceanipulchritudo sp.]